MKEAKKRKEVKMKLENEKREQRNAKTRTHLYVEQKCQSARKELGPKS